MNTVEFAYSFRIDAEVWRELFPDVFTGLKTFFRAMLFTLRGAACAGSSRPHKKVDLPEITLVSLGSRIPKSGSESRGLLAVPPAGSIALKIEEEWPLASWRFLSLYWRLSS